MHMRKLEYWILTIGAIIVIVTGINFGLKGSLYIDKSIEKSKILSDSASIEEENEISTLESKNIARGLSEEVDIEIEQEVIECDVVIAGAGTGGFSAAIASAREGADTCLIEETDWLGGMLTAAGVAAIDGRPDSPSGIFKEIIQRVENRYAALGMSDEIHNCQVSYLCFEPSIGDEILKEMAAEEENLRIFYNSKINKVYREGNRILGVNFIKNEEKSYVVNADITVDATEYGDLMYLAEVPFDLGIDEDSNESLATLADQCIQPLTYVALLKKQQGKEAMEEPANYDPELYKCTVKSDLCPESNSQFNMKRLLNYGRMPNDKLMINIPSHSYGNDFNATADHFEEYSREEVLEEAKNYSRGFIYFIQTELGLDNYVLYNEFSTEDSFAKMPYVRESRRLQGEYRLTEDDIVKGGGGQRSDIFNDAIAIGDYPIDLHFCSYGVGDIFKPIAPYQIPYRVTIPENIDGFMVADKNISVSHIVNGTTRLQPVTTAVGQAVGIAAAMASNQDIEPRDIDVRKLQENLFDAGSNLFFFKDLAADHFAYPYVGRMAVAGHISGYNDFTFKPDNTVNESDLLKIFRVFLIYKNQDEDLLQNIDLIDGSQAPVKRSDMVKNMYNLLYDAGTIDPSNTAYLGFTDIDESSTLYDQLSQLVAIGVFSNNSNFRPSDYLTRAEAMTLLGRTFDILFVE